MPNLHLTLIQYKHLPISQGAIRSTKLGYDEHQISSPPQGFCHFVSPRTYMSVWHGD